MADVYMRHLTHPVIGYPVLLLLLSIDLTGKANGEIMLAIFACFWRNVKDEEEAK